MHSSSFIGDKHDKFAIQYLNNSSFINEINAMRSQIERLRENNDSENNQEGLTKEDKEKKIR